MCDECDRDIEAFTPCQQCPTRLCVPCAVRFMTCCRCCGAFTCHHHPASGWCEKCKTTPVGHCARCLRTPCASHCWECQRDMCAVCYSRSVFCCTDCAKTYLKQARDALPDIAMRPLCDIL